MTDEDLLANIIQNRGLHEAPPHEEFKCSNITAQELINQFPPSPRTMSPFEIALGVPVVIDEGVPMGKLQLWRNGKMVGEIDV